MNPKSSVLVAVLAGLCTKAEGQSRLASDSELEAIREALELDEIPEWKHYSVLEVNGTYTAPSDMSGEYLKGEVYFEPYAVQFGLCVMEARFRTGYVRNGRYDWGAAQYAYWNWLLIEGGSCDVSDRSEVPGDAVVTNEPIPSASLSYILRSANELLALYYEHIASNAEVSPEEGERLLNYRDDPAFRLSEVRVTPDSVPGIGFAYSATYRSPNLSEGPSVTFSITESGFVIHSVGFWIR